MRAALRFVLLFLIPAGVAVALHYGTGATQIRLQQQAGGWIARALCNNPAIVREALAQPDAKLLGDARGLGWDFRLSIVLAALGASLLIPASTSTRHAVNLFTALAGGFALAFIAVGFNHMGWGEFLGTLAIGITGAMALWVQRNRRWRISCC